VVLYGESGESDYGAGLFGPADHAVELAGAGVDLDPQGVFLGSHETAVRQQGQVRRVADPGKIRDRRRSLPQWRSIWPCTP